MNPSTRIFALTGFTMSLAKDLSTAENQRVKYRATCLLKSAHRLANFYPSTSLDRNKIKQVSRAIMKLNGFEMSGDQRNLVPTLSLILCGVDEVLTSSKNPLTLELFGDFQKKITWLNALVDPKLDREADYIKGSWAYDEWMAS